MARGMRDRWRDEYIALEAERDRMREALLAIKNDARLIRSLAPNGTVTDLATGIYVGARNALSAPALDDTL